MKPIPPIQLTVGNPKDFLRNLSKEIKEKWKGHTHYHDNLLTIKNDVWEGTLRDVFIDEGLSMTFLNLNVKQPCQVYHESSGGEPYYHIYFDTALGQRVHGADEKETPIGLAEKYSFIILSSGSLAHTDISVCEINNVILHMSRKFFYEEMPIGPMGVDAAAWRKLVGVKPMIFYGTCNERILKTLSELDVLDLPDYSKVIFMKGSALQLLSQMLQIIIERSKGELTGASNPRDVRALLDINIRIEQHFDEPLPTIDEVAAEVHMSATKFKEFFKKTFGASYYTYYKQRRMDRARELLLSKKHSVAEVAGMVGFLNSGKFSKQFKMIYNVLPKDLLKMPEVDRTYIDVQLNHQNFRISTH